MLSKLKEWFYFWFGEDDSWEDIKKVIAATGISEPVFSFVECVRNNPRRFNCHLGRHYPESPAASGWWIKDEHTGEMWVSGVYSMCEGRYSRAGWLTSEELKYLIDEIWLIYDARGRKLNKLKDLRKQRSCNAERKRLIGIYCKGE